MENHGTFAVNFDVMPDVGDVVLLEPGLSWGKIWCVIEKRLIGAKVVWLCARPATPKERDDIWARYKLSLDIL